MNKTHSHPLTYCAYCAIRFNFQRLLFLVFSSSQLIIHLHSNPLEFQHRFANPDSLNHNFSHIRLGPCAIHFTSPLLAHLGSSFFGLPYSRLDLWSRQINAIGRASLPFPSVGLCWFLCNLHALGLLFTHLVLTPDTREKETVVDGRIRQRNLKNCA